MKKNNDIDVLYKYRLWVSATIVWSIVLFLIVFLGYVKKIRQPESKNSGLSVMSKDY